MLRSKLKLLHYFNPLAETQIFICPQDGDSGILETVHIYKTIQYHIPDDKIYIGYATTYNVLSIICQKNRTDML
jgi:hypothetical protein